MNKLFGWIPTPKDQERRTHNLMGQIQGTHLFGDLRQFEGSGESKLSLPYLSVRHFKPDAFEDDRQTIGDCTSHGACNAFDISRAVEIHINKEREAWVARGATELIFRYRGHSGDGMNPGQATEFLIRYGQVLRQQYPFADLSHYNPRFASGTQLTTEMLSEASKHPAKYHLRVTKKEEIRDALANGYGLHMGSNLGVSEIRGPNGVCSWTENWPHDMCIGGCDDTRKFHKEILFVILNSWGIWNKGPTPPWGVDFPGGAFLITGSTMDQILRQRDTEIWAIGNVQGWPLQDLPSYGFEDFLG